MPMLNHIRFTSVLQEGEGGGSLPRVDLLGGGAFVVEVILGFKT